MRGEIARFDITTKAGKLIVAKDKRITVKHVREMEQAGLTRIAVPEDFLLGRVLAHNVVDTDTGEILANANEEITETLLAKLRKPASRRSRPSTPTTSTRARTSRRRCASTRPPTRCAAQVAIYRMMRPGRAAHGRRGEDALQRPVLLARTATTFRRSAG